MIIQAVFENGVFIPVEPVNLPEHATVLVFADESSKELQEQGATVEELSQHQSPLASFPDDVLNWQEKQRRIINYK